METVPSVRRWVNRCETRHFAPCPAPIISPAPRLEAGETLQPRTVDAVLHALEKAGVVFINGDQPEVRVKRG
jgi:hypothetical protein